MILFILIVITLETAVAIWALKRALSKSDVTFFSVFVGDAFLKLTGLGFVAWWLGSRHMPFVSPLLTLGFGLLAASLIQIPFLYKAR